MSVPYGQPPAAQQPGPPRSSAGPGLGEILALATGGLGLMIYLLSFSDDVGGYLRTGLVGVLLLGGALLAAASVLPKAPATTLVPAAVLVVTGTLFLLIDVTNGPVFLGAASDVVSTPGLVVVTLVLAFLQSVACVGALLVHAGVVKMAPRPSPYPQPSWGPPPAGYPAGPGPGGYSGQQPVGSPSRGFAQPPQQPYIPPTTQYGQQAPYGGPLGRYDEPGQYGERQYGEPGQYGERQYGDRPYGERGQHGEPGQYSEPAQYSDQPTRITEQPTQHSDQPGGSNQHGGQQPGTPPGGFGTPDKS